MLGSRSKGTTPVLNPNFTVKDGASLEDVYGIELFPSIDDVYALKPDLAVIATPTAFHAEYIIRAVEHGIDVLVEKPGAMDMHQARQIVSAVKANGVRFMISYQRRFHPSIIRLREILASGEIGNLMSIKVSVASHVPDWHPYENFRDLYACRSDLGGGVLRTEIHEIDLLTWLFGLPKHIYANLGCRGPYDIDVEDSAELLLDYDAFSAQVNLCFMQRKQERKLSFIGQDGWVEVDLIKQCLTQERHDTGRVDVIDQVVDNDAMFREQARHLLYEFESGDDAYQDALIKNATIIDGVK